MNSVAVSCVARVFNRPTISFRGHGHGHGHSFDSAASEAPALKRITAVGAGLNTVLCVVKLVLGSAGGSASLVADGVHALSDFFSDGLSFAAVSLSRRHVTRSRYPFGLGRIETLGSTVVSLMLLLVGVGFVFQSIKNLAGNFRKKISQEGSLEDPEHHHPHSHDSHHAGHSHFELTESTSSGHKILWSMVFVAAASAMLKEVLFRVTRRIGIRSKSNVVLANAYHHRADALSSVAALGGVIGIMAGVPLVDSLAALFVGGTIAHVSVGLLRDSFGELLGYQHSDTTVLRRIVRDVAAKHRIAVVNTFASVHGHEITVHSACYIRGDERAGAVYLLSQDALAELHTHEHHIVDFQLRMCSLMPLAAVSAVSDRTKERREIAAGAILDVCHFYGVTSSRMTDLSFEVNTVRCSTPERPGSGTPTCLAFVYFSDPEFEKEVVANRDCTRDIEVVCESLNYQFVDSTTLTNYRDQSPSKPQIEKVDMSCDEHEHCHH